MSATDLKKPDFELTEEGEVVMNKKGKATVLATYDSESGHLEFVSEKADRDFRPQVQRAIMEDVDGVATQNKIKSYGIKGHERDEPSLKEPPKPKASKLLGDKTPAVVEWYLRWRPQEAIARYGIELDANGEPRRAHCMRKEKRIEESANTGQVGQVEHIVEREDGIIATRQTHLTFLRSEIVGAEAEGEAEE